MTESQGVSSSAQSPGFSVPAPGPEVKIRTFRSDIRSMMESGGGIPQSRTVTSLPVASSDTGPSRVFLVIGIVIVLIILGGAVYYFYPKFFPSSGATELGSGPGVSRQSIENRPEENILPVPSFEHATFFRSSPDERIVLTLSQFTGNGDIYRQEILKLLQGIRPNSSLVEIEVKDGKGLAVSLPLFFDALDALVLDASFLASNFNPDFTMFVYRDGSDFRPGYVLQLKPGQTWLFARPGVAGLESSRRLDNLFLSSPGTTKSPFRDVEVSGQPARRAQLGGGEIVYGLFRDYVVLSTSEEGLKEAVLRL